MASPPPPPPPPSTSTRQRRNNMVDRLSSLPALTVNKSHSTRNLLGGTARHDFSSKQARKRLKQKARSMRALFSRSDPSMKRSYKNEKDEGKKPCQTIAIASIEHASIPETTTTPPPVLAVPAKKSYPRRGKRPTKKPKNSTNTNCDHRPTFQRSMSQPVIQQSSKTDSNATIKTNTSRPNLLARDGSRRLVIESFDSFNHSSRSLMTAGSMSIPRKPNRRLSNDEDIASSGVVVQAFETFNESQRTLMSETNPRKPARRLSVDDSNEIAPENKCVIEAFETFNHSQRKSLTVSPRKPNRRLSVDDDAGGVVVMEQAFDNFNESQRSLYSTPDSPRKPRRRVSTDGCACPGSSAITMLDSLNTAPTTMSPRKPSRRMSKENDTTIITMNKQESTRSLMSTSTATAPSKPARRLSNDDSDVVVQARPALLAVELFNDSQRSLLSHSEGTSKLPRTLSKNKGEDEEMEEDSTLHNSQSSLTLEQACEAPRRPMRRLSRDDSAPALLCSSMRRQQPVSTPTNNTTTRTTTLARRQFLTREESAPAIFYHGSPKRKVNRPPLLRTQSSRRLLRAVAVAPFQEKSERSLMSISEQSGPRKPQRKISADESSGPLKKMMMMQCSFQNHSQRSLMTERSLPRAPKRTISFSDDSCGTGSPPMMFHNSFAGFATSHKSVATYCSSKSESSSTMCQVRKPQRTLSGDGCVLHLPPITATATQTGESPSPAVPSLQITNSLLEEGANTSPKSLRGGDLVAVDENTFSKKTKNKKKSKKKEQLPPPPIAFVYTYPCEENDAGGTTYPECGSVPGRIGSSNCSSEILSLDSATEPLDNDFFFV